MMGYGVGFGFGSGGWLLMLGWVVLIVAAIALVVWLVMRSGSATRPSGPARRPAGQDALELLGMRFARGEITKDEYLAAKQTLEAGR
jgi:uncharacterized membrane protein